MKNISQKIILMVTVFVAATFIADAQSTSPVSRTDQQTAAQQATPEKFFNIQLLDDAKSVMDAAQSDYKKASKEQSEATHIAYLKARRMYTVELERQMAAYDKTSATGQKIRQELRRINTVE